LSPGALAEFSYHRIVGDSLQHASSPVLRWVADFRRGQLNG
jgi:hypothetical protein